MEKVNHQSPKPVRLRGKVLNFLRRKGYGFILGEDNVKVFVHFSDIRGKAFRYLTEDEPVEYSCVNGPKGLQASDVVRLDPPEEEDVPPLISNDRTW